MKLLLKLAIRPEYKVVLHLTLTFYYSCSKIYKNRRLSIVYLYTTGRTCFLLLTISWLKYFNQSDFLENSNWTSRKKSDKKKCTLETLSVHQSRTLTLEKSWCGGILKILSIFNVHINLPPSCLQTRKLYYTVLLSCKIS